MKTFLVVFLLSVPCVAQLQWSASETVKSSAGATTEVKMGFNNTQILGVIGTTRFITWMNKDSLFVSSSQNYASWSAPVLVYRGGLQTNLPTLAASSDGKLIVGWSEGGGIKYSSSTDLGKTWTTPQTLASRGSGLCLTPGQNGVVYALWHSGGDETASDVQFSIWRNGSWSASQILDAAAADKTAVWASLAVSGSNLYAVWRENSTGQFRVYMTHSNNGGTTWDTPRNIVTIDHSGDPTVAVSGGANVVVAYQNTQQIYTVTSGDGGNTFAAPKRIGPGLFARIIANENGFVGLAWERFMGNSKSDENKQTGFVYSTDYGWTFSADSAVSEAGSKLGLVNFSASSEMTLTWFNVNNGGTVVAKRTKLSTAVSVRKSDDETLVIAPNPASEMVLFRSVGEKPHKIRLLSLLGVEQLALEPHSKEFTLDISSLPVGLYLVETHIGKNIVYSKLMVY